MKNRWWYVIGIVMIVALLGACGKKNDTLEKKVSDLDFTVVSQKDISPELMTHIEERQQDAFTLIYKDGENMFVTIGYGQQQGGGYSIRVNALYLGDTSICISTTLLGPEASETGKEGEKTLSYPYIVLKMEAMDCPVIFDM